MICAGLGSRRGIPADAVLAAIDAALAAHRLERTALGALATVPGKMHEPAIGQAARRLRLPLLVPPPERLRAARPRCITASEASFLATGTGSASEAAALAVCGPGGRLLGPRLVHRGVTCALAIFEDMP